MSNNKPGSVNPTVTYTSSNFSTQKQKLQDEINLSVTNTIQNSTISNADRPWMAYYVTSEEFFNVLRIAYEDTYGGSDTPWHPEDMYTNVSCVLEIVTNTLSNMAKIKSGRPLSGIKES